MKKKAAGKKKKTPPMSLEHFAARLKAVRVAKGYTQESFAYEHGFGRSKYGEWERGGDIKLSSIIRIAKALGVDLHELLCE